MWGYPGKKLLFMGQEFAQRREWSEERALDWDMLRYARIGGAGGGARPTGSTAKSPRSTPAIARARLRMADRGRCATRSLPGCARRRANPVAVIANMTPNVLTGYRVPLPHDGVWAEIMNTDAAIYGGSGVGNMGQGFARDGGALLTLPPLATIMLEYTGKPEHIGQPDAIDEAIDGAPEESLG
jgi:1,4-alpha-glucan branching enzyme